MHLKELHLLTDNLPQTVHFYKEVLQLSLLDSNSESAKFTAGATQLFFHQSHNQNPIYHFAFTIPSNQIEQAYRWMKERVALLEVSPNNIIADFSNWNAKAFYFLDNNGNILEFIARFELANPSLLPFTGTSIICISEIGWVTEDVIKTCEQINAQYGTAYFSKQPPLSTFAVIGDDNGLLILVPQNRPWFPTQIHSSKNWWKGVMENERTEYTIEG